MEKIYGEMNPEERRELVEHLANAAEEGISKIGFTSWDHFAQTVRESAQQFGQLLKFGIDVLIESHRLMKFPIGELAKHGWYMSPDMSVTSIAETGKLFSSGRVLEADQQMVAFFKNNESRIEGTLNEHFPARAPIIKRAFDAHRRGYYELSIPVMLAQADGICFELIGKPLYQKRYSSPLTAHFADRFGAAAVLSPSLEPLRRVGQITVDSKEVQSVPGILNRHGILHGSIIDYATPINSYKVISLLSYLAETVREAAKGKTA